MGADGGFTIAKVRNRKIAIDLLHLLQIGRGLGSGYDTGVKKLWGEDVYIGAHGTNIRGPVLGPLMKFYKRDLHQSPSLTLDLIARCLDGDGTLAHLQTLDLQQKERMGKGLIEALQEVGICSGVDLILGWDAAIDWSTLTSFETWT